MLPWARRTSRSSRSALVRSEAESSRRLRESSVPSRSPGAPPPARAPGRRPDDLARVLASLRTHALRLLGGIGAQLLEILAACGDGALDLSPRIGDQPLGLLAGRGDERLGLGPRACQLLLGERTRLGERLLGLRALAHAQLLALLTRAGALLRGIAARVLAFLLGLALRGAAQLLGLGLRLDAHALGLRVNRADGGDGVVARAVGLRARVAQQLLGLLLSRMHTIGGGTVGLGDPFAAARLSLFAQLVGRALCSLDDAGDASRRGLKRVALGVVVAGRRRLRLHLPMVDLRGARGEHALVAVMMAGSVGYSSLQTESGWAMIEQCPSSKELARSRSCCSTACRAST
jgi:hypothetical protein